MRGMLCAFFYGLVWLLAGTHSAVAQAERPALSEAAKSCFAGTDSLSAGGDPGAVIQACSLAISEQPTDLGLLAALFTARGVTYRRQSAYSMALADFEDSLRLNPQSVATGNMRAWTFQAMGDHRAAEEAYSAVLQDESMKDQVSDSSAVWQAYLSRCVVRQHLGKFALAADDCEIALQGWRNGDLLYFAANAYTEIGRCAEAVLLLEEALLLEDVWPRIYEELGYAHSCAGETQKALAVLDEGLARFPGDETLQEMRRWVSGG